jgi:hypothetical protein
MVKHRFRLQGGLGNQLFIYFAAASYAIMHNQKAIIFDVSGLGQADIKRSLELDKLTLPIEFVTSESRMPRSIRAALTRLNRVIPAVTKRLGYLQLTEVGFENSLFQREYFEISGYFQSWRYSEIVKSVFLNFDIRAKEFSAWTQDRVNEAREVDPILCHIRRGDYLQLRDTFGVLGYDYYLRGIEAIRKNGAHGPVWVMTDSPQEISSQFLKDAKAQLILEPPETTPLEVFSVMQACQNFVISNSTFSWWAAYSSGSSNVIVPKPWFKSQTEPRDLIPMGWTSILSDWS